jgi:hypothetical protein
MFFGSSQKPGPRGNINIIDRCQMTIDNLKFHDLGCAFSCITYFVPDSYRNPKSKIQNQKSYFVLIDDFLFFSIRI